VPTREARHQQQSHLRALQPEAIRNDIRACGHQKQSISTTTETLGFCLGSLIIFLGSRKWSPAPGGEGEEGGMGGWRGREGPPRARQNFYPRFVAQFKKASDTIKANTNEREGKAHGEK
jgi:hypothetical protein